MDKILNITSKKEYASPVIEIANLDKPDVLQISENAETNLKDAKNDINSNGGDFISFIINGE